MFSAAQGAQRTEVHRRSDEAGVRQLPNPWESTRFQQRGAVGRRANVFARAESHQGTNTVLRDLLCRWQRRPATARPEPLRCRARRGGGAAAGSPGQRACALRRTLAVQRRSTNDMVNQLPPTRLSCCTHRRTWNSSRRLGAPEPGDYGRTTRSSLALAADLFSVRVGSWGGASFALGSKSDPAPGLVVAVLSGRRRYLEPQASVCCWSSGGSCGLVAGDAMEGATPARAADECFRLDGVPVYSMNCAELTPPGLPLSTVSQKCARREDAGRTAKAAPEVHPGGESVLPCLL